MLAVMYIPSALILQRASLSIALATVTEEDQSDLGSWMERHGLKLQWRGQLGRLLVILAPLLSRKLPSYRTRFIAAHRRCAAIILVR